jgi:uncharacterized protein (DUF488 family)
LPNDIFTIGHSTHELPDFTGLLERHGVLLVADVRRFPGSRRMPRFGAEALAEALSAEGIGYEHLEELGGRRRPHRGSGAGAGWENAGFRGYADHMATHEFAAGLDRLEELARARPTAVMCAEGQWRRCHRRLLADVLEVRGWRVLHIDPRGALEGHRLTPFARVEDGRVTYPAGQTSLDV